MATVLKHIQEPVPRPSLLVPGIPPRVDRIILRAMEKHPNARFQRAREMAEQLKEASAEVLRLGRAGPATMRRETGPIAVGPRGPLPIPPRGAPGAPGTCQRCGAANSPRNRFCTTCGYELSGVRGRGDRFLAPNGRPLRCRVLVRTGPLLGNVFLLHQDITTFGRTTGNDIVIPDGTVSRNHARLLFSQGRWFAEDMGSSNGTWVNGTRVSQPTPLSNGDELRLGDDVFTFELVS
jgi:hypothetical protein